MKIKSTIRNSAQQNHVIVETNGNQKTISIPAKPDNKGSSVNGGELLFLSLATCFSNDIYREASRRNIDIISIEVSVDGNFGNEGEPASNIQYTVDIQSDSPPQVISDLIRDVDKIAEIHNTLRKGIDVVLKQ